MVTRLMLVILSQYMQIVNYCAVHLKPTMAYGHLSTMIPSFHLVFLVDSSWVIHWAESAHIDSIWLYLLHVSGTLGYLGPKLFMVKAETKEDERC